MQGPLILMSLGGMLKLVKSLKQKLRTIINIRRNQRGEYRCIANNTCGNESAGMFIDVYCKNLLGLVMFVI